MILITGATGNVGRELITALGEGANVRALVRHPESADLPDWVDVVRGDLSHPASLEDSLEGVDSLFLLWPFNTPEETARYAPDLIRTVADHVPKIVYLSAEAADGQPDSFWAMVEQEIERTNMEWTFLRPVGFAANTLQWAEQTKSGDKVRWVSGEAARSLIHERDIASVAARCLLETGHAGARYVLSGPRVITQREQVAEIGKAIRRHLTWEEMPRADALGVLSAQFGDREYAEMALDAWAGFEHRPEIVTSTVEELTGRRALDFSQWAEDHASHFSPTQVRIPSRNIGANR